MRPIFHRFSVITVLAPRNAAPRWGSIRQVLKDSLLKFYAEDSLTVSASIAYYSVLSIFPLLLLLLLLSGIYIRHYQLSGRLAIVLQRVLPMKADFILQNLEGISQAYGRVGFASFLLLLWSSAGVFLPREKALNRAWGVDEERSWLRRRLLALEMALIFGLLILASTALVGVRTHVHEWLSPWLPPSPTPLTGFGYRILLVLASFSMTLALFVVLFHRLPNRAMRLREVLPSALLTALLWEAARSIFTLLLPRFNYGHVYGSIGAVVALMTWAYISSAVMLFGARVSGTLYRTLKVNRRQ